jgi:uncharacterized LabA/DUF88 family protein
MKALVIVDGYNLFHALRNFGPGHNETDLVSLSKKFMGKDIDDIEYLFFTAPPQHLGRETMDHYLKYNEALRLSGFKIVEGRFQKVAVKCRACGNQTHIHKEKETNVAISVAICKEASSRNVQEILLYSADSDFAPALSFAREVNPGIVIGIAQTPLFLKYAAYSLISKADKKIKLKQELIHKHQLTS